MRFRPVFAGPARWGVLLRTVARAEHPSAVHAACADLSSRAATASAVGLLLRVRIAGFGGPAGAAAAILDALDATGLPPHRLALEIDATELNGPGGVPGTGTVRRLPPDLAALHDQHISLAVHVGRGCVDLLESIDWNGIDALVLREELASDPSRLRDVAASTLLVVETDDAREDPGLPPAVAGGIAIRQRWAWTAGHGAGRDAEQLLRSLHRRPAGPLVRAVDPSIGSRGWSVAPVPVTETLRLEAVMASELVGERPGRALQSVATAAARLWEAPVGLVSLVADDQQWFAGNVGLPGIQGTSRSVAFCAHTIIEHDGLLLVPDALLDERFAGNPLVVGAPHIRFYVGAVISSHEGLPIGALCVTDVVPRQIDPARCQALLGLAEVAGELIELRRVARTLAPVAAGRGTARA